MKFVVVVDGRVLCDPPENGGQPIMADDPEAAWELARDTAIDNCWRSKVTVRSVAHWHIHDLQATEDTVSTHLDFSDAAQAASELIGRVADGLESDADGYASLGDQHRNQNGLNTAAYQCYGEAFLALRRADELRCHAINLDTCTRAAAPLFRASPENSAAYVAHADALLEHSLRHAWSEARGQFPGLVDILPCQEPACLAGYRE